MGAVGGAMSAACTAAQVTMVGGSITLGVVAFPLAICVGLGALIGGIAAAKGEL